MEYHAGAGRVSRDKITDIRSSSRDLRRASASIDAVRVANVLEDWRDVAISEAGALMRSQGLQKDSFRGLDFAAVPELANALDRARTYGDLAERARSAAASRSATASGPSRAPTARVHRIRSMPIIFGERVRATRATPRLHSASSATLGKSRSKSETRPQPKVSGPFGPPGPSAAMVIARTAKSAPSRPGPRAVGRS